MLMSCKLGKTKLYMNDQFPDSIGVDLERCKIQLLDFAHRQVQELVSIRVIEDNNSDCILDIRGKRSIKVNFNFR